MGRDERGKRYRPVSDSAEQEQRNRACDARNIGQTCTALTEHAAFVLLVAGLAVLVRSAVGQTYDAKKSGIRSGRGSLGSKYAGQQRLKGERKRDGRGNPRFDPLLDVRCSVHETPSLHPQYTRVKPGGIRND